MRSTLAVVASVTLAVATTLVASPLAAEAATLGPGYEYQGQAGSHIGGYLDPDGTISYCINAGAPSAVGKTTTDDGILTSVNGLGQATMTELNSLLSAHGNTSDDNTAAAVAMAVWSIAGPDDYNREGGDRYVLGRAPVSQRAAIQSLADEFRAEAAAYAAPAATATLTLRIDPTNTALGWLDVTTTAPGRITLTNAAFADSRLTTRDGVADGAHLALIGTPSGNDPYRVSASGSFIGPPQVSPAVHVYSTPGSQTLTSSGTSSPATFSATATDTTDRLVPTITTHAPTSSAVGQPVSDTAAATGVPTVGEDLAWTAYLQPSTATSPDCSNTALVFSSRTVTIARDGDYASPPFVPSDPGRVLWVVTATIGGVVVAHGTCGDGNEVTVVVPAAHLPVVSG